MARPQFLTITANDVDFRVALCGPQRATDTLVCFNGVGLALEALLPLAKELHKHRVVLIDAPGIGGSSEAHGPYRLSHLSASVAKVLDELGFDRTHLFGVSWGGALAQQFAYQYPERCVSLVLAATSSGLLSITGNLGLFAQFTSPKKLLNLSFLSKISPELTTAGRAAVSTHSILFGAAMKSLRPKGYVYQLMAMTGWTSWPWLPKIKTPTLILLGKKDPLMPPTNGRIICGRMQNARLDVLPYGHLFVYTQPFETARKIDEFLSSIQAAAVA